MNKTFVFCLFFFFTSSSIALDAPDLTAMSAVKSPLSHQRLLTNITLIGNKVIAVGERGHIVYSTDGNQWQQANVPVNVLLTSISFADKNLGFATGHDATILKTMDGGENWTLVNYQPELDRPLLSIHAQGSYVVAVGAYGLYWQSNDKGESWSISFHDELLIEDDRLYLNDIKQNDPAGYESEKQYLLPHFNHVYMQNKGWYLAGEAGFLAKSTNYGIDWEKIDIDYNGSFFSINETVSKNLIVAGLRGNYFRAEKDGTWKSWNMKGSATINDILVVGNTTFLFANSGNLYYSNNNEPMKHHLFEDGKAVMAGVILNSKLILATEAGIKVLPIDNLK